MNKLAQLSVIISGSKASKEGVELCRNASSEREIKAARAFRRVLAGAIVLAVCFAAVLLVVMFINISSINSENDRYGSVQDDGSIRYTDNGFKYVSAEELGLSDAGLKAGDGVVIFFDSSDNITSAYPKEYYDEYTGSRLMAIILTLLLGGTVIIIYALVICRLTPFGRDWYLYCREKKGLEEQKLSKKQNAAIYAVSLAVSLIVCAPQIVNLVGEIQRMQEIEAFGRTISDAREAAGRAQEMTDKLDGLNSRLSSDSALEDAKNAADNVREIADSLNGLNSSDESGDETAETSQSGGNSEEAETQTAENSGTDKAQEAADKIHDIMHSIKNGSEVD